MNRTEFDRHKRGDTFIRIVEIPPTLEDGYFAGYSVASQLRNGRDEKIADFTAEWDDPQTTRRLTLRGDNTSAWPTERLRYDIQFTRTEDGFVVSTSTVLLQIERDETRP